METAGSSNALDVSTPTQDLKFMQASNINVSNFVSVKLSGRSNYKIWKAQLLCLIESQLLLHIIDAENQFPVDKGIHMIGQYDKLVKGWIFGSVNEKVLNDLVDLGTAQMVWMKLDSLFNLPVSDTEGDSSNVPYISTIDTIAPVISTMREDLKYLQALNVDVSNFVSENLVGKINYHTWKTDMLFLIESHELLHIIHAEARFPQDKADPLTQKYDSLVRGWILNTMNDKQSDKFRMYRSVQLIWKRLESTFTYQPETSDSDKKDPRDTKDDSSSETKDLNYMHLKSNVNVSNFVSVKLSGHSNYNIWRDQMLSLLESHCLLHTIQILFPWDEDDPMTKKYGNLVRVWILSTMNEKEHLKYAPYQSVQLMWRNIESTFDETEDLKYIEASNVNVSNFVSVKLSGCSNYNIWKDQMVCLLESHNLLHIIHMEGFRWDEDGPMTQKYGNLVRGWILSTMNDEECHKYRIYRSVKLMWRNIELTFGETEDLKYMEASNVNLSNFVLVNLYNYSTYSIWRAHMLYLLESHNLLHIITDGYYQYKYEELVKGWILRTMNDKLLKEFPAEDYAYIIAKELWEKLESHFTKGYSRPEPVVSASTQDLKYTQALNVNVSNFVSVKLSGRNNYRIWKGQMLCLIESQRLLHIIDKEGSYETGKYNTLVRGWIFSTMNEQLLNDFTYDILLAKNIWAKLKSTFDPAERDSDSEDETSPGFEFRRTEFVRVPEIEDTGSSKIKKELYKAAVEGCWWKAKSILKIHKNAATEVITTTGDTILHIAVETGHNYFLEKLLDILKTGEDIEKKNDKDRTALHVAVAVGNTHAAQLLVQKRTQLLQILDCNNMSPLDIGYTNKKINTCAYMLKSALSSDFDTDSIDKEAFAIMSAIITKEYDLAQSLLEKFPECASQEEEILMSLTITFPSDLGFIETFIYPSFNNVHEKTIARCSLLFHPNFFDKCVDDILRVVKICNYTCCSWLGKFSMILFVPIVTLYPIYQLICFLILLLRLTFSILYLLMWKVFAVTLPPIKNIEKKKKEYKEAKKILSLVCSQMGTSNSDYEDSLFEAVRQDTYEVVDEILRMSPATIDCKDEEGYNIIQSAIMNRAEKVYSLLYHIIERIQSYRDMEDSSENNLVHLAGKLAPSFVLERTTGATLQLQREILWHEEVKKLLLPFQLRGMNKNKETPAMVFTREHRELMKEGENWIKKTAESCSITAALIVTVVFAAAITVPGGSQQESGIPVFKKEAAFTVFAVSNAFSLFTASTALLLYLSILTARFSEKDFLVSLPRRLIFGLLMLFLSTIAMMVAFGAILFLVFCDQRPWMLAPICVFTCLPISVIVTVKLPLLVDLIRSTYFPIFGNRSYLESCSVNRKNTIFTE